ncbi:hypothetical protein Tco_0619939 [Tanacetum coccineum]
MGRTKCSTQPPTRTDEQLEPRSSWLIIGKRTFLSNSPKDSKEPISRYQWTILSNTNFFRADSLPSTSERLLAVTNPDTQFCQCCGESSLKLMLIMQSSLWEEYLRNPTFFLTQSKSQSHNNNIHRRPDSAVHHTGDDFILGNLKFVPKGETVEVFGMAIPDPLITEAIQQSSYYPKYLEMVAENTKKTPQETPAPTKKPSKHKLPQKVRKGKPTFQLVDEDDEAQQESVPQEEGDDPDLELAKKMSLEAHQEKGEGEGDDADMERAIKLSLDPAFLPQGRAPVGGVTIRDLVSETTPKLPEVVGKGKAIVTEEQVAHSLIDLSKKKRTTDQFILVRRDQTPHDSTTGPSSQPEDDTSEKVIHESSSTSDSERTESETEAAAPKGNKDQGEVDSSRVTSGVSIPVSTQGQAGSDPEKAHEALAGPDPEPMQEDQTGQHWEKKNRKAHVSLAGPNPEHMDDEFLATAYPKVHENLKLITDERVIEDNPESHSGSMSSMKNLDDTDNFGDQFLYDKPTEDDQEKSKVIEESDSTIPDPSHQTVTSTPPVIAPFTDVSSTKPSSLVTPPPINTEATTITTPSPSLSRIKNLKRVRRRLSESKGNIKQAEEKQYSTYSIRNPANYHLYHALMEALIADEDAMNKEVKDRVKNHKRKHDSDNDEDDDDDKGPSPRLNQGKSSKRRRHDSGASGSAQPPTKDDEQSSKKPRESDASASKQHPALTSTGWQITDTRDAVVDSSMPRSDTESEHSEQSSDDIPMQDEGHVSDLEDTDNAHIPKVSTTTWFKPIPEGERPATPEPEWTIPPNDFPEPENNWANTYATTYKVPAENKLQRKTYDIGSFIKWFCRRTGKKKLCKADLEGPAFNLVKAFHKNSVFLQYQMDECHKLLTNKVDLSNPEGHQILQNVYEPLPLRGPPGDKERKNSLSISKLKAARYLDFGLEELVPSLWVESEREYDISAVYDITHWWFRRNEFYINKHSEPSDHEAVRSQIKLMRLKELHKFSDGTLTRVMEKLDHIVKDFHLFEYNKGMETRKWSEDDKRRSKDFITAIEKRLQIRRIF